MANTLYAIAKLGSTDGRLIAGLTVAADRLASHMDAQHLANSLWALAALDAALPDTLATLLVHLSQRQTNALDISSTVWALARLHCPPSADLQAHLPSSACCMARVFHTLPCLHPHIHAPQREIAPDQT